MRRPVIVLVLATIACAVGCEKKHPPADGGAPTPAASAASEVNARPEAAEPPTKVEVPEVRIRSDAVTAVHLAWLTPGGTVVNDDAPFRIRWNRSDGLAEAPNDQKATGSAVKSGLRIEVRPLPGTPNATLTGDVDIVVCDAVTHSVCLPVHRSLELGFVVVKDAAPEATVSVPLPAAK